MEDSKRKLDIMLDMESIWSEQKKPKTKEETIATPEEKTFDMGTAVDALSR